VLILPQLEQSQLYEQLGLDRSGGLTNAEAGVAPPSQVFCPSAEPPTVYPGSYPTSNYAGITGAGKPPHRWELEEDACGDVYTDGVLPPGRGTRIREITDGTSHTLLIGERVYSIVRHWMNGAAWFTGQTFFVGSDQRLCLGASKNIVLRPNADAFYKHDTQAPPGAQILLLNDLYFGSDHPGGAQFAHADGSVHFVPDSVDFTIYQDLATKEGGEPNRWTP
jgi:prepilin-type processing-associated H-X9-DG protein